MVQKITNWFGNNAAKHGASEATPKTKHVKASTIRDVIKQSHQERIRALIAKETTGGSGSPDWLKHYPAALSKVMETLTEAELEEAKDTMREWNTRGVPREIQRA